MAIEGLGIGLDALDDGIVVAAGLAFCQVFVRVLFAFEEGIPLIAPDPAVAARPHGEAAGVGRQVVDVGRYLQSPAAVAGTVGVGAAVVGAGRRAVGQGAIQAARPLAVEPHRAGLGQAQCFLGGEGPLLWPLLDLFAQVGGESSYRVVAHEARARRRTGIILSSGPHYRAFTEQLLGDLPQGSGGQVEHELFSAVADVEAVAVAGEIGVAADFGPLRV